MAPVDGAARDNDVETLRRLLDEDPGLVEGRNPPLIYACLYGSLEAAALLLDRGADANRGHVDGTPPLMYACLRGHPEVVSLLLSRGADPTIRGAQAYTPLIAASYSSDIAEPNLVAVMRLLLKDGRVDVDARNRDGRSAVWWPCYLGRIEEARVLLVEGLADHTIADNHGQTPMAVAGSLGRSRCIPLLQWYEGELEKAFLISKARAVVDATESITKAPEKGKAKTRAKAQRAREEAAPAYLRGRVERGEALPEVLVRQGGQHDGDEEEEERGAVYEFALRGLAEDLFVEMMEGVRYRRWVPGEAHGTRG